ncbi:uridine kinase family protein [Salinibacterium sp. PAMC 21357]|uniref:uridine kinase family protein n=1 Tax=Salinibacterium sp. PAMC 21357 TaxID=1112215 RepID=UPI0002898FCA|nr:phosphoglycerate transporter [Salinibacterium sp. PAMC 21357]
MTLDFILANISELKKAESTALIGVSGFGGAGKSTLARDLTHALSGGVRIRGDDFLDPDRSHRRSSEWDGVERVRLRDEVLSPLRLGVSGSFRRFDWSTRGLGVAEALPDAEFVVVDAIGLFHPELDGAFDLTIWIDVDLEVATAQGKSRDQRLGRDHEALWDEVWVANERDFVERFDPRGSADLLHVPGHLGN